MPGKVKVKISSGKNLPVMDRSSDTTDAYVEIKLGSTTYKTDVCRKSLHPQWNTDWYRFEVSSKSRKNKISCSFLSKIQLLLKESLHIPTATCCGEDMKEITATVLFASDGFTDAERTSVDDSELQDEPLQIRLMDHDTYSANDAIGKVYLNLNPLLLPVDGQLVKYGYNGDSSTHHEISGWIPVFDTMHGIRGEVNVTVKVELFSDFNRFRQSSCGVQFFYSPTVPQGYYAKVIHGFVEELLVNDDPEYQWIDKIRTPRASNEARQTLFFKLSGELQRKIGVKALNLGGNAVIGYRQSYDLEGESGIVARGIGTAVTLVKSINMSLTNANTAAEEIKEERAQNYLKFVGGDKSFRLNAAPNLLTPIPSIFSPTTILPDLTHPRYKQLSKRLYSSLDAGNLRSSHSNPGLNEDMPHSSLKILLKQEDKRGKPCYGLSQRIKNLKYSQNSLSKKMTALKSKLGDSIGEEIDEDPSLLRKRKTFKRTSSDSSVMAELLARSVLHAHNSLSCILEVQNSPPHDKNDDNDDEDGNTLEKLEPIANLLSKTVSEPNIPSDDNASEICYTSSDSSSSCSDYDYDNETLNYNNSNIDLETISNIVKDVEMIQRKNKIPLQKQYSLPALGPNRIDSYESLSENVFKFPENTCGKISVFDFNSKNDVTDERYIESMLDKTGFIGTESQVENLNVTAHVTVKKQEDDNEFDNFQGIVPEAIKDVEIKQKGLIKTAMQTMLLEKVSLMGTYTPPTSPKPKAEFFPEKSVPKSTGRLSDGSIKFEYTSSKPKIPKSASSISFCDYLEHTETVLGIPFTSIALLKSEYFKRQKSQPCLSDTTKLSSAFKSLGVEKRGIERQNCFSDTQLNKPLVKTIKTQSHDSSLNEKKRFHFLHRNRKSSESDSKQHKNIIFRIFHNKSDKSLAVEENNKLEDTFVPDHSNQNEPSPIPSPCVLTGITLHRKQNKMELTVSKVQSDKKIEQSPARLASVPCIHRRSSDSDLSITPKGNSLTGSDRSGGNPSGYFMRNNIVLRSQVHQENFDMLEYPFLTMSYFPPGFVAHIGGSVSARSVKRLEIITNVDEPESRDTWWSELRMEIRSHARSLNCNAVLGYSESSSICDDICVLSACGTAAVIDFTGSDEIEETASVSKQNCPVKDIMSVSLEREKNIMNCNKIFESPEHFTNNFITNSCTITHLPYDSNNVPIKTTATKCALCHKGKVPEVLIATIEPPDGIPSTGKGCLIESYICRPLKDVRGESIAKEISDGLPFLEYELHRLLINKLKIKGMNAIFGLKFRMSVGERMIIGIATGTAMFLSSLPSPVLPKLVSDQMSDDKKLANFQKLLYDTVKKNKEIYQIKDDVQNGRILSDDESDDEPVSVDLSTGNKDCCVLEVDDPEDEEVLRLLMEERPPDGFHVVNTESVPGLEDLEIVKNLQMFTQIYRVKFHPPFNVNNHFHRLLQSVYFKLRRMVPCALCDLQFRIDLPEPDEVQLCVFEDDLIFKLDEDQIPENSVVSTSQANQRSLKYKQRSPSKYRPHSIKQRHIPHRERHGVDITPLSYVPGGIIERYLGNLNFFFIRETTSIREEGGLSGFIHSFVTEVLAIVRAHVTALGGNAMVAFFLTEIVLLHNLHKNQGQCLINVGGDVVSVTYLKEDA
ncbi:hypothetical protein NQ314_013160 [Rhamnusium bicolor]|uniref:C2 domain-containing protein n=1 Tax=Rhamnusium bicolor TaxID=1586634 RepID=A0AAV8X8D3_9CUCU|nr:hypothetical protein NQ314_013160 [Rhamnusium bicolor]